MIKVRCDGRFCFSVVLHCDALERRDTRTEKARGYDNTMNSCTGLLEHFLLVPSYFIEKIV